MRDTRVTANGIDFTCLEAGEGPLLLLLHGYPDNAWSWEHQMPAFAAAGYRVVAPFLRGFPPSEIPASGFYDRATLAMDVKGMVEALSPDAPCHLVGQDWGAALSYGALAAFPRLFASAVVMAIPHPVLVAESLTDPIQIARAFHWWFFQLPGLAEQAVPANDFALIDYLWDQWSPGHDDPAHVARIKTMLAQPGAVAATLGYYRAAFNPALQDPALAQLRAQLDGPITVPTLALCGADDVRVDPMSRQANRFSGSYRFDVVPDSGHFLHRERPDVVNTLVLDWLKDPA